MPENIFTIDDGKNKRVHIGHVVKTKSGKEYLAKKVTRAAHYFRIFSGYAIQTEVLERLRDRIIGVLLLEEDTGKYLWSDTSVWFGDEIKSKDWGHGVQTQLPEKYMEVLKKKQ